MTDNQSMVDGQWSTLDRRRPGTRFVALPIRSALNSPATTGMDFWSVNPYVGCEFGCSYCYARFAHQYVTEREIRNGGRGTGNRRPTEAGAGAETGAAHATEATGPVGSADAAGAAGPPPWHDEDFEHRIFVKAGAAEVVALTLRPARLGGKAVVIGTATDPYQPAERQFRVTRGVLERLAQLHGLRIGLITKSPLVARDIDVLRRLSERSRVTIHISLISVDTPLVRLLEARSPAPAARLRALEQLVRAGLEAGVMLAPVLPGITDDVPHLEALLVAARSAGAKFVRADPLRLYPAIRRRFLPLVTEQFPDLLVRYERGFDARGIVSREYAAALQRRLARLRRRLGVSDGLDRRADGQTARWPGSWEDSVQEELQL